MLDRPSRRTLLQGTVTTIVGGASLGVSTSAAPDDHPYVQCELENTGDDPADFGCGMTSQVSVLPGASTPAAGPGGCPPGLEDRLQVLPRSDLEEDDLDLTTASRDGREWLEIRGTLDPGAELLTRGHCFDGGEVYEYETDDAVEFEIGSPPF